MGLKCSVYIYIYGYYFCLDSLLGDEEKKNQTAKHYIIININAGKDENIRKADSYMANK